MTLDDLEKALDDVPGYREAFAREYPDHDAAMAVVSARAKRGWTQKKLAKRLNVSIKAIHRLESGNWDG